MKSRTARAALMAAGALALCLLAGCGFRAADVGDVRTDREIVELGGAERVRGEINIGAGELSISGGAGDLMDASFTYNVTDWKPRVEYVVSGGIGRLTLSQPSGAIDTIIPDQPDDVRYEWDVRLSDEAPLELAVNMGAGEGDLRLESLNLSRLTFQGGAGDVSIDLSGSSVSDLEVRLGAGEVTMDLSGAWEQDLSADIGGGVGALTLALPTSVGVRVEVSGGLGGVNATGLRRQGNVYTNEAYGESQVTLNIDVTGGIGEVNLDVAE
jgi:hypothetical protein